MKTEIPPSDFPVVKATAAMVTAYLAGDYPGYERQRAILLSFIENIDAMVKSAARHAD